MPMKYDHTAMRTRLQNALDERRLSMRSVSLDAGLSETALHGIIKLGRDPGVGNLVKICDTIGVPLSHIMYGREVSPDTEEILDLLQQNPSKRQAILALLRG